MEGKLSETEGHFVVERSTGRVTIPKADVMYVGTDLQDIYQYKLSHLNGQDVEELVRLAQWCLVADLRESAVEVLERARELAPNSSQVNRLLESIRRLPPAKISHTSSDSPPRSEELPDTSELSSATREIPSAVVSRFSVQIQPMLARSCATAGCHDSSHSGSLVLQRSPRPVQKVTQKNLRSVLSQVNMEDPDRSPLLLQAVQAHGKANSPPLVLGASDRAFATLSEWVHAVSGKDVSGADSRVSSDSPVPPQAVTRSESSLRGTARDNPSNPRGTEKDAKTDVTDRRVYSNKPIAPTPSRIRAGMFHSEESSAPPVAPIASPTPKSQEPRRIQDPPTEPKPSATTRTKTPPSPGPTNSARNISQTAPPGTDEFQPVDPFDPEIFNRMHVRR